MLVYLDMCCLKRPFDDQSQMRIRLETEAVLAVLSMEPRQIEIVRSKALWFENSKNPVKERAEKVSDWMALRPIAFLDRSSLGGRVRELKVLGFKALDALHIATAEQLLADALATCDDNLLAAASRHQNLLHVKVVQIVEMAKGLMK